MLCDAAHCDNEDDLVAADSALLTGSDPSAEGVQRDLLPLIEGSVISTKHGPVATDHMLFIASGAFTSAKPSDMMAELQVGMGLNFGLGCLHSYAVSCCCVCSSESESMFACLHCVLCMLPSGFQPKPCLAATECGVVIKIISGTTVCMCRVACRFVWS